MRPDEAGVRSDSVIFYHLPSGIARETFLYPMYLGRFYCDKDYYVSRNRLDSFLFMYVVSGSGFAEIGSSRYHLHQGSAILIDCYQPHKYFTNGNWDILWVHFDGISARKYYEYATQKKQLVHSRNPYKMAQPLYKLLDLFIDQTPKEEALLGKYITDILTEFIGCANEDNFSKSQVLHIDETMKYIAENLHRDISLEQLADQAMLSPFYFSRLFKKETGFTPHQYVIAVRLDYSRYLLRTSKLSIKEVAFRCGFHSESSYCTSFRKTFGTTPTQYREG